MNPYYTKWKERSHGRDHVFQNILARYNGKPLDIIEIGCARRLEDDAPDGDGWSTFFWCEYIEKYGGSLHVVDIDPVCVDNCRALTTDFVDKIDIQYHVDDGVQWCLRPCDLIYLDAADDNELTVRMFENVDRDSTDILVDDANRGGKADLLRPKYPDYDLFKCGSGAHEMIFYPKRFDS